ncbi:AMP-binding protein [Mycobacterium sp. 852002-51057_SCH5723018]|uniref:AMP-binding protein n=1 Tax=Mycobacterium sp. 852002-51057_SCH5723018 TaxID=1834094 RepID=UPI0008016561|nr:AMP-binding protein [Mycobacterium sp. 852002-51057_SCH5723018]OBG23608.1 acyl-CoA synthetase [Mycobacterium sp. 852002-51057_SCH5723018]
MAHIALSDSGIAAPDIDSVGDVVADFAAAARDWPYRSAIEHNGTAITYREFAEQVRLTALRYLARRLDADGPSGLIGALVSHTPAVVEHLLGILQARATYCPIDATLPVARKQALAAALGVDRLFAPAPDASEPMNLRVETLDEDPEASDTDLPQPLWHRSDPAYVLCTSGSTGTPKPVVVSRRALTATVRALRDLFAITPEDRVLQFASLGWDTCLEEILPALTGGATLVFDDEAHSGSFPRFVRMLAERKVTVIDLPTAFWHELVLFLHEERAALPDSVRLVIIGGERIDPTRLGQWRDLNVAHVRLLNTYGCTETTMITHAVQLAGPGTEPEVAARDAEAPLGRPLPHVRDYVTEEGELLISGLSLATGYLGLAELTGKGFPVADHGFGPTRWFHTGDMVSRGEHGLLYSRGRADEQVKVLGVRVHPAEVEAQLNTHPAVAGAVVVGERMLGHTSLTAYVALAGEITPAELKRYLRERLPSQFVPSRVKFVTALAYTSSGKVDRAATRRAAADYDSKGAGR